ncbi:MAG: flagellin [Bacteroidota bacterium]
MGIGDLNRINSNVQSLQALGSFNKTNDMLGMRQLRLSTGMRINRAEDDSAGYAIAKKLESRVRGQAQAMSNVGDAKSMLTVAEGALGNVMDILQTMKEKSVQAANDSLGDSERNAIQNQIDALSSEITDILETAEFNGKDLFTDAAAGTDLSFHVGSDKGDSFDVNIGRTSKKALIGNGSSVDTSGLTAGDVTVRAYNGTSAKDYTVTLDTTVDEAADTENRIAAGATFTPGATSFAVGETVEFRAVTNEVGSATDAQKAASMRLEIKNADGEFETVSGFDDIDLSDGAGDVTVGLNGLSFDITDAADGTDEGTIADGFTFSLTTGGLTDGDGGVAYNGATGTYTSNDGLLQFSGDFAGAAASDTFSVSADTGGVNVTSNDAARDSIDTIETAIQALSDQLGSIGDSQSRLSFKLDNLQTAMTNNEAARSRIEDADFAKEQMEIVKLQILQQTGIASLAQSNAAPQSILSLLG